MQPITDTVSGVVMREALFEPLDRLDHLELLAGAGRAGDHCDALAPEHQRLHQVEAEPSTARRFRREPSTGSRRRG
jgi:hypothetical protein